MLLVGVDQETSGQLQTLKAFVFLVKLEHNCLVEMGVEEDEALLFILLIVVSSKHKLLADGNVELLILCPWSSSYSTFSMEITGIWTRKGLLTGRWIDLVVILDTEDDIGSKHLSSLLLTNHLSVLPLLDNTAVVNLASIESHEIHDSFLTQVTANTLRLLKMVEELLLLGSDLLLGLLFLSGAKPGL